MNLEKTLRLSSGFETPQKRHILSFQWALRALTNAWIRASLHRKNVRFVGASPALSGRMPVFEVSGWMEIGSHCRFYGNDRRCIFTVPKGGTLKIGDRCGFNAGTSITALHRVEIGDYTRCGSGVWISDSNMHEVYPGDSVESRPVIIGRNVWICSNAIVLRGSEIGDHSVISAGSVVKGTIPPRSYAIGNPAKVVKTISCPDDWVRR